MQLNNLKPGVYFWDGGNNVKSFVDWRTYETQFGGSTGDLLRVVRNLIGWEFAAIEKRRDTLAEIPYEWEGTKEADPLGLSMEMLQRIDEALQTTGAAYLWKDRGAFGVKLLGLTWLDPRTMTPNVQDANVRDDIDWYQRNPMHLQVTGADELTIKTVDLLRFQRLGLRELVPETSATAAISVVASALRVMYRTSEQALAQGAIPPKVVVVPPSTSKEDKLSLRQWLERVVRRNLESPEQQFVPVSSGIEFHDLVLAPNTLFTPGLREYEQNLITQLLAAHQVPQTLIFDSASNFATARQTKTNFVQIMAQRLEKIAKRINTDPDIVRLKVALRVNVSQHEALQREELEKAITLSTLTGGAAIMTVDEAREWLGLDPNAELQDAQLLQPVGMQLIAQPQARQPANDSAETDANRAWADEVRKAAAFYSKPRNREFRSDVLTTTEIAAIKAQSQTTEVGDAGDAFFKSDSLEQRARAAWERRATPVFRGVYDAQMRRLLNAISRATPETIVVLLSEQWSKEPAVVQAAVQAFYDEMALAVGGAAFADLPTPDDWQVIADSLFTASRRRAGAFAATMTETSMKQTQDVIAAWLDTPEATTGELRDMMRGVWTGPRPDAAAVTETTYMYSQSRHTAWQAAGFWGYSIVTMNDGHVRPSHEEAAKNGPYPFSDTTHQPPVNDDVNCRCVSVPVLENPYG